MRYLHFRYLLSTVLQLHTTLPGDCKLDGVLDAVRKRRFRRRWACEEIGDVKVGGNNKSETKRGHYQNSFYLFLNKNKHLNSNHFVKISLINHISTLKENFSQRHCFLKAFLFTWLMGVIPSTSWEKQMSRHFPHQKLAMQSKFNCICWGRRWVVKGRWGSRVKQ